MFLRKFTGGCVGLVAFLAIGATGSKAADLDQCVGTGLQKAQCECNLALSIGTEDALRQFTKKYSSKGTACAATASTAPQSFRDWNGGNNGNEITTSRTDTPTQGGGGSGNGGGGGGSGGGGSGSGTSNSGDNGSTPPDHADKGGTDPNGEDETTPPPSALN